MAKVLYDPTEKTSDHSCSEELPGAPYNGKHTKHTYHLGIPGGMVVQCSCGIIYKAEYSGYPNLGSTFFPVGWWEGRKYRKKMAGW